MRHAKLPAKKIEQILEGQHGLDDELNRAEAESTAHLGHHLSTLSAQERTALRAVFQEQRDVGWLIGHPCGFMKDLESRMCVFDNDQVNSLLEAGIPIPAEFWSLMSRLLVGEQLRMSRKTVPRWNEILRREFPDDWEKMVEEVPPEGQDRVVALSFTGNYDRLRQVVTELDLPEIPLVASRELYFAYVQAARLIDTPSTSTPDKN